MLLQIAELTSRSLWLEYDKMEQAHNFDQKTFKAAEKSLKKLTDKSVQASGPQK